MDVLTGGSERSPGREALERLRALAPRPGWVALAAALVLVAGLVAVAPVASKQREAARLDRLRVELRVPVSSREQSAAAFGVVEVVVHDPLGSGLRVDDVLLRVPGLAIGRHTALPARTEGGRAVVPVRFYVPDCRDLSLPGDVVLRAARDGQEPGRVRFPVMRGGRVDGTPLLVVCGLAPRG